MDFISDPEFILSYLESDKQFIFWHSNAWSSNVSYFLRSAEDLKRNYIRLALMAADKLQTFAWIHKSEQEIIFGSDPYNPQGVFINPAESSLI